MKTNLPPKISMFTDGYHDYLIRKILLLPVPDHSFIKKYFMTIEFQTPYGKVSEKLVNSIRNKLLELTHVHKKISRVEVLLREDIRATGSENRVCEINLAIYGANLYVHTRTESFEKSAKDAIKDLGRLVKQQVQKKEMAGHTLNAQML